MKKEEDHLLIEMKKSMREISRMIEQLCDVFDPDNSEDQLIPAKELKREIGNGARFRYAVGHSHVVIKRRK